MLILFDIVTQRQKFYKNSSELGELLGVSKDSIYYYNKTKKFLTNVNSYIVKSTAPKKEFHDLISSITTLENEVWKNSPLIDKTYYVSNMGRVKRVYANGKEKILRLRDREYDRRNVIECKVKRYDDKLIYMPLKRLVLSAFNESMYRNGDPIIHKNGFYYDCNIANLSIVSKKECATIGGLKVKRPYIVQLDQITREPIALYKTQRDASIITGICSTLIYRAIKCKDDLDYYESVAGGYRWDKVEDFESFSDEYPDIILQTSSVKKRNKQCYNYL